jgi:hypothetical protein
MTRKLLMSAAVVAIALVPSIGIGTADARDGGFHAGGFHGVGFHAGGFHHRGFVGGRRFRGEGFGYGGLIGYAEPDAAAEAPSVSVVQQPAPAVLAADRPPCHEMTTLGVIIERGTSCSRGAQ